VTAAGMCRGHCKPDQAGAHRAQPAIWLAHRKP
jgi:hypothetical protein